MIFCSVFFILLKIAVQCRAQETKYSVLLWDDFELYHRVAWRVEHGKVAEEPLMLPLNEWDQEIGGKGTVLVDPLDKMYKAWYISQPSIAYMGGVDGPSSDGTGRMLNYAYSQDGVNWIRPELDVVMWKGKKSNILIQMPGDPAHQPAIQYACVFVNVNETSARKYEMMIMAFKSPPGFDNVTCPKSKCMYRYYASDGIHWKAEDLIPLDFPSDSLFINKETDGSYTAYIKGGIEASPGAMFPYDVAAGSQRVLYRSTSPDGKSWSPFALILQPDWRDAQGVQWISALSVIKAKNAWVGHLPVFDASSHTITFQWAVSRTGGSTWWRPDRRPCIPLRELGEWGGGMMWPYRLIVKDRDSEDIHAYFSGCQGTHGDILSTYPSEMFSQLQPSGTWHFRSLHAGSQTYSPVETCMWFRGAFMRATWSQGRYWALVPAAGNDIPGEVVTADQGKAAVGKKLVVNAVTKYNGTLTAALLDKNGQEISGYGLSECLAFQGDEISYSFTWKGGDVAPAEASKVHFNLLSARLYSFEWK